MMLCTRCSEPIYPVVSFDIDGTMGDYHDHFLRFAIKYLGNESNQDWWMYSGHQGFRDWFCEAFEVETSTWYDIKLAYRQGAQKRFMPAYPRIVAIAQASAAAGCENWIATTRPYLRLDNIDPDTREWLRRHDVPYQGLIFDEDKYETLASRIDPARVVAIYEDLPDQYDAAEEWFGPLVPYFVKTTWNRAHDRPNQGTHTGALKHLNTRLRVWRSFH